MARRCFHHSVMCNIDNILGRSFNYYIKSPPGEPHSSTGGCGFVPLQRFRKFRDVGDTGAAGAVDPLLKIRQGCGGARQDALGNGLAVPGKKGRQRMPAPRMRLGETFVDLMKLFTCLPNRR